MLPDANTTWTIIFTVILGVFTVGVGLWWQLRRDRKAELERSAAERERAEAGWDAILGKSAVTDRAGSEIEPAQPGLVHRVAQVEEAVIDLRNLVAGQNALERLVERHATRLDGHDDLFAQLIAEKFDSGAKAALEAVQKGVRDAEEGS